MLSTLGNKTLIERYSVAFDSLCKPKEWIQVNRYIIERESERPIDKTVDIEVAIEERDDGNYNVIIRPDIRFMFHVRAYAMFQSGASIFVVDSDSMLRSFSRTTIHRTVVDEIPKHYRCTLNRYCLYRRSFRYSHEHALELACLA